MTIIAIGLILLAFIGVPLFSLFGAAAIMLFLSLPEGTWSSPAIDVFGQGFAENPSLMTIPLFTFAGYLLAESGMPRRLITVSRAWLGWMPGGLAVVCLGASAFFTTFTGGSGITIVAVGGLLLPAMLQEKYPDRFALGLVTTGGSLGILFPPSVPLILYGIIANLNMNKLLVAGIMPGIVVVVVLSIYAAFVGMKTGFVKTPFVWKTAWQTLWAMKWEAAIPVVLLAGMGSGILRIHEASVFTAVYVLFVEVVIYRDINIKRDLPRVATESMTLVGAILIIMSCAIGFTAWMIQAEIPQRVLDWMQTLISSQFIFLIILNVFLIFIGMIMEIFTAIIVAVPLVLPLARAYGLDPYHFAIIFLLNLEIAYLAPPLGINLFISSIRFGRPVTYLYRSVLTFIAVLFAALMLVCYVPIITTWLPSMMKSDDMSEDTPADVARNDDKLAGQDFGMTNEDIAALDADAGSDEAADTLPDPVVDAGTGAAPAADEAKPAAANAKPAKAAKKHAK
ncbi:MAG TPA: TRAP transporter large permease [Polyangiales bacterium]